MKCAVWVASALAWSFLIISPRATAGDAKASAKHASRFEVEPHKNVAYYEGQDADPVKHKLDIYVPKGQTGFPIVVFIHGGAWKSGDKQIYGKLGDVLCDNGVGV